MRSTENKKVTVTAVDSKYRCNLCGHLTKSYGQRCPHCEPLFSFIQQQM